MAPQEETALQSGPESVPAQQVTAPVAEEITQDKLDAIFASKDPVAIEAARKQLFDDSPSVAPAAPVSPEPSPAPSLAPETPAATDPSAPKKFSVSYHGEKVEVDDPDGWLGMGGAGSLKRSKVHADRTIERLKKREEEARVFAQQKAKEAEDYRKLVEEYKSKPPAVQTPPTSAPAVAPVVAVPKPVAPVAPDLPDDPTDWTMEDQKANKKFQTELTEYNRKLLDYIESIGSRSSESSVAALVDSRTKEREDALRAELANATRELEQERKRLTAEREEESYWKGFSDFQALHKEYATPEPIRETHVKVMKWMDELAGAYGYTKPVDPADTAGINTYNDARSRITAAYLAGNKETIAATEGVSPAPKGYENYFKLADEHKRLQSLKEDYVARGELGPNASLHKVYLHYLDESGQLDQDMNELRTAERVKGAEAVSKAIQHTAQTAVTIPNTMSAAPEASVGQADYEWFEEKMNPYEYRRMTAQERERYQRLEKAFGLVS